MVPRDLFNPSRKSIGFSNFQGYVLEAPLPEFCFFPFHGIGETSLQICPRSFGSDTCKEDNNDAVQQ